MSYSDQELADAVVALGVGSYYGMKKSNWYSIPGDSFGASGVMADTLVRDWRVAGALMEKMPGVMPMISRKNAGESLPRAITEAYVIALT